MQARLNEMLEEESAEVILSRLIYTYIHRIRRGPDAFCSILC